MAWGSSDPPITDRGPLQTTIKCTNDFERYLCPIGLVATKKSQAQILPMLNNTNGKNAIIWQFFATKMANSWQHLS